MDCSMTSMRSVMMSARAHNINLALAPRLPPLQLGLGLGRAVVQPNARRGPLQNKTEESCLVARGTSNAAAATVRFWPVLVQAYSADPVGVLLSVGACIAAAAFAALLVAAIPALFAFRRSAHALEALLHTMREEIPDTASALRLSGLEIADAVEEVSSLGSDLTDGLRASARMVTGAEQGLRDGAQAVTSYVIPSMKQSIPQTKEAVEKALKERAKLQYSEPEMSIQEMAGATKVAAKRLRTLLGAAGILKGVTGGVQRMRRPASKKVQDDYDSSSSGA